MSDYIDDTIEAYATAKQVEELNRTIIKLRKHIVYLESEVARYEKIPIPKTVVQQIVELEAKNRKLQSDLKYYKNHVPVQVIINKEQKEKPTRRGGIPR